ncbi:hypothetical protein KIPB_005917, partial [Kipferlia bialata]|eukprot:g5917.t1
MAALIQQTKLIPGLKLILMSATVAPDLIKSVYPDHGVFVMGTGETQEHRITERISRHAIKEEELCQDLLLTEPDPNEPVTSVLVFLCAIGNINDVLRDITSDKALSAVCEPIVLHSSVSDEGKHDAVFTPASEGKHKIILTTNIAETSLTFPNTTHVIDTCMSREAHIDPNSGAADFNLQTRFASHSALLQRRGRIGRTMDGVYISLCPMSVLNALKVTPKPELVRGDIDYIYLRFAGAPSLSQSDVSPLEVLKNTLTPIPQ